MTDSRPTVTVIIPALNEAENIASLIDEVELAASAPGLAVRVTQILVVDNGSTDGTADRAREAGADAVREDRRGYGRACLTGAEHATGSLLIYMDGDRSEVPAEMHLLAEAYLENGSALVIGSRVRGNLEPGALSPQQLFGNRFGALLMRLTHGVRITDFGPYRIIARETLLGFDMQEMTFGWPAEMIVRASKAPGGITEVPVSCRRRAAGESKVSGSLRASLTTGYRMIAIMLRIWREDRRRDHSA